MIPLISNSMEIWTANSADNTLSVIKNNETYNLLSALSPREIIILRKTRHIYVSECKSNTLGVYDINTKKLLKIIELPGEPRGLTLSKDESKLYLVLKDKDELIELDTTKNSISKRTSTPHGPRNIAVDKNYIYVTCNEEDTIAVYELKNFQMKNKLKTAHQPYSIKVDNNNIYITNIGDNLLQSFSNKTFKKNWETNCGEHPTSLAYDNKGNIYVTNFDSNKITVIDINNGKFIKSLSTGKNPFELKIISDKLIVSNLGDNSLTVYDTNGVLISRYNTGKEPHGFEIIDFE